MNNGMFIDNKASVETCWRSIVLLGRNTASYKFALAKSLLETPTESSLVRLEDLALPFAKNIAEHVKVNDKQAVGNSNKFLDTCRKFNVEEIGESELHQQTMRLGFRYVLDAFHNVGNGEVPRFFEDARKDQGGIILSDQFYQLINSEQLTNLNYEVESRWRLWETAISLNISPNLLTINPDETAAILFVVDEKKRRQNVTSSRDALNGYQKGKCFYCQKNILIERKHENSCDVDHFFPDMLKHYGLNNLNQVWNLVLTCVSCNRGEGGKFQRIPDISFLYLLNKRNNFYVESHHPLRETIINQTGKTNEDRKSFLQTMFNSATDFLPSENKWKPLEQVGEMF